MKAQRKKKLNKPKLQLRMIGIFLAISSFAAFGQALLLAQSLMDLGLSLDDPEVARAVQEALPGMLASNILWTVVFLLPFSLLVGIHVTHRVAGPAYRIEKHLEEVANGQDPKKPCFLRQNDELQELSNAMNGAFVRLSSTSETQEPQTAGA
ncbi:MAG: hypothetical protein P1V35_03925 [Planctomycetota bacterium]|nr:hypothetical protein [Planctomycetota bacterium]